MSHVSTNIMWQESGPSLTFQEAHKICLLQVVKDLACVQLVYGRAGWYFLGTQCAMVYPTSDGREGGFNEE